MMISITRAPAGENRAVDTTFDAVEAAIDAGWSVEQFRRECAKAWGMVLRERATRADKEWAS